LLNLSILNGPGEAAVHSGEVGGEGVTCNVSLREGRPRISDHILVIGPRKNNISTNEVSKEEY